MFISTYGIFIHSKTNNIYKTLLSKNKEAVSYGKECERIFTSGSYYIAIKAIKQGTRSLLYPVKYIATVIRYCSLTHQIAYTVMIIKEVCKENVLPDPCSCLKHPWAGDTRPWSCDTDPALGLKFRQFSSTAASQTWGP